MNWKLCILPIDIKKLAKENGVRAIQERGAMIEQLLQIFQAENVQPPLPRHNKHSYKSKLPTLPKRPKPPNLPKLLKLPKTKMTGCLRAFETKIR